LINGGFISVKLGPFIGDQTVDNKNTALCEFEHHNTDMIDYLRRRTQTMKQNHPQPPKTPWMMDMDFFHERPQTTDIFFSDHQYLAEDTDYLERTGMVLLTRGSQRRA
jgi:hypothetical protein